MSIVRIGCLIAVILVCMQATVSAVNNGDRFPDLTLPERVTGNLVDFHSARQNNMAIVYVDFFGSGSLDDLALLAKISDETIYQNRPDGSKIKVFAIGSMNSFLGEDRFTVLDDDSFSVPDLLAISSFPYMLTIDCQGNVIGQIYFEPPSDPGDPNITSGLSDAGKGQFIQESVQRAVKSGACQ